jgi:hypothetical protein
VSAIVHVINRNGLQCPPSLYIVDAQLESVNQGDAFDIGVFPVPSLLNSGKKKLNIASSLFRTWKGSDIRCHFYVIFE